MIKIIYLNHILLMSFMSSLFFAACGSRSTVNKSEDSNLKIISGKAIDEKTLPEFVTIKTSRMIPGTETCEDFVDVEVKTVVEDCKDTVSYEVRDDGITYKIITTQCTEKKTYPKTTKSVCTFKSIEAFCGGVFVAPNKILSAAHCFLHKDGDLLTPATGRIDHTKFETTAFRIDKDGHYINYDAEVKSIHIHKSWANSYDRFVKAGGKTEDFPPVFHADLSVVEFKSNIAPANGLLDTSGRVQIGSMIEFIGTGGTKGLDSDHDVSRKTYYGRNKVFAKDNGLIYITSPFETTDINKASASRGDSGSPVFFRGAIFGIISAVSEFDANDSILSFLPIDTGLGQRTVYVVDLSSASSKAFLKEHKIIN